MISKYRLEKDKKILDLGCGRGDFLKVLLEYGMIGFGVDQSDQARKLCSTAEIKVCNIEETLPYKKNTFDYVFSKSVLEHFYYPEKIVNEIHRVLKPGGLVITMVPDWKSIYKMFYEDYTHRTPFTKESLQKIFYINGFDDVQSDTFIQLPFLWKMPWLKILIRILACVTPEKMKTKSNLVRFSKEGMLISIAKKPK